jgi:ElaB/YqjD/DUF883 family membrane-anchored ribosome-binding protein
MKSVLAESKIEKGADARSGCTATCCGHDVQEGARRIEKGVNNAKAAISAKLEDGKIAAERLLKRGRYAVEDGIEQTAHNVKRHPFSSVAIGLAAGAVLGFLVPRIAKK